MPGRIQPELPRLPPGFGLRARAPSCWERPVSTDQPITRAAQILLSCRYNTRAEGERCSFMAGLRLQRSASVGGQRSSPDSRRPPSDASLPLTPLLGVRTVHHTRHLMVDTDEQSLRRPETVQSSPFPNRSSTPFSKQLESRPWTRDFLAPPSTADGRRGSRRDTSWPLKPSLSLIHI